jgi:diguanylate cyclase (GGDEF)-like protein/PAS domain S-box-containing protein
MNNASLQENNNDKNQLVRHILVVEDPELKRAVTLDSATYSIGRHSSNSIILSSQRISRHHATLLRRTDVRTNSYSYWILDGDLDGNRSRNGIFINGKKCLVHELKHGDVIEFGAEVKARYHIISDRSENIENIDDSEIIQRSNSEEKSASYKETMIGEKFISSQDTILGNRPERSDETVVGEKPANYKETIIGNTPHHSDETVIGERPVNFQETMIGDTPHHSDETVVGERPVNFQETMIGEPPQESEDSVVVPYELLARDGDSDRSRLTSFAELNPHPIVDIDLNGKVIYLNSAALVSFPNLEALGTKHPLLSGLVDREKNNNGILFVRELTLGDRIFRQNVHYLSESEIIRNYAIDITEQKKLEAQFKKLQAFYAAILAQIGEGVAIVQLGTRKIIEANHVYCQLLGYSRREIQHMTLDRIIFDREILEREIQNLSQDKTRSNREVSYRRKDNSLIKVDMSLKLVTVDREEVLFVIVRDLTEQKNTEEKLRRQASHDEVTGLPNQMMFDRQLSTAIAHAKRNQTLVGVMILELDYYKNLATHLGNTLEDQLLQNCAERLKSSLRSGDTICYWGGDKFVALMPQVNNVDEVAKISQRILDTVKQPFKLGEHQLNVRVNIGISIYPQDGLDLDALFANAELALDRTKEVEKNSYQFHSLSMHSRVSEMLELENSLYHALEKNELVLYYQPQVNIESGEVKGVEALLRWQHPDLGLLLPADFINLAEQTGLIVPIGEWVIKTACTQNKAWQDRGLPPVRMSVNLSPLQFQQPNLAATVARILQETELEPSLLELEMNMDILMQNVDFATAIVRELHEIGVNIAVDDFGSGFSNFSYNSLKELALNTLKIDRSFVQTLQDEPQDLAIVSAIVTIGQGFNLRIIAEGVETQEQFELLRNLDCEEMQGNWFSRPLPEEEAIKFLPTSDS